MKLNTEEKNILDAYEKGKMKLSTPTKKELKKIKADVKKTWSKKNK